MLQVANAQQAGAKAALVYDNEINDYFLMLANDSSVSSISIPGLSVPRKVGQLLVSSTQVIPPLPYKLCLLASHFSALHA